MEPVDQPWEGLQASGVVSTPIRRSRPEPGGPWAAWCERRRSSLASGIDWDEPGLVLDLTGPGAQVIRPPVVPSRTEPVAARMLGAIPTGLVTVAAVAIVVLNVLDVVTTRLALAQGGTEGNPFASLFVYHLPVFIAIKVVLPGLVAARIWLTRDRMTPMLLAAMWWVVGAYSLAIVVNTLHLL